MMYEYVQYKSTIKPFFGHVWSMKKSLLIWGTKVWKLLEFKESCDHIDLTHNCSVAPVPEIGDGSKSMNYHVLGGFDHQQWWFHGGLMMAMPYFAGQTSSWSSYFGDCSWDSTAFRGSTIEVMGRWKRRHLAVGRDFVEESFTLADGRTLFYKQPEAGCKGLQRPNKQNDTGQCCGVMVNLAVA